MYREKIDTLQAAEERLLAQKTAAQNAAAKRVRQAEKDGAALIAAAQEAARRTAAEALRQAEAQADTERQVMLAHTEPSVKRRWAGWTAPWPTCWKRW